MLKQDVDKMLDGLKSKDKIKNDWFNIFNNFDKKRQNSDFSRGAERIYYWLFNQFGTPNSAPIGADLFFETYNAFVHIDVKTAKLDNPSDYKGKIPIGANQTSYKIDGSNFQVNLPIKYSYKEKTCLTYLINIIYDLVKDNIVIKAIILVSVPNGILSSIYGKSIIDAGKSGYKGKGFRYAFSKNHKFISIKNESRVRIIYSSDDFKDNIDKKIGLISE
ncbi:MAG: hypothetical protein AB1432_10275 [Bacteroidota bacterium]